MNNLQNPRSGNMPPVGIVQREAMQGAYLIENEFAQEAERRGREDGGDGRWSCVVVRCGAVAM
jgi:hypothetical protein